MNKTVSSVKVKLLSVKNEMKSYFCAIQKKKKSFEPRHDKTNKMSVRPAKTQISLGICPVWSESCPGSFAMKGTCNSNGIIFYFRIISVTCIIISSIFEFLYILSLLSKTSFYTDFASEVMLLILVSVIRA